MRFLVKATTLIEAGNAVVCDPSFSARLERIIGDLRPDAGAAKNDEET